MKNNIKKAPVKFWEDLFSAFYADFMSLQQLNNYHHLNKKTAPFCTLKGANFD